MLLLTTAEVVDDDVLLTAFNEVTVDVKFQGAITFGNNHLLGASVHDS